MIKKLLKVIIGLIMGLEVLMLFAIILTGKTSATNIQGFIALLISTMLIGFSLLKLESWWSSRNK